MPRPYTIKQISDEGIEIHPNCPESYLNFQEAKQIRMMFLLAGKSPEAIGFMGVPSMVDSNASQQPVKIYGMTPEEFDAFYDKGKAVLDGFDELAAQLGMRIKPDIRYSTSTDKVMPSLTVDYTEETRSRNDPHYRFVKALQDHGIEAATSTKREKRFIDIPVDGKHMMPKLEKMIDEVVEKYPDVIPFIPDEEESHVDRLKKSDRNTGRGGGPSGGS